MIMLFSAGPKKGEKGAGGGILGNILSGSVLGGVGQKQQVEALIKKLQSTGMRCGAVYKKQKLLDAKVEAIAQHLGIQLEPTEIKVDIGEHEIAYFENLITELENDGGEPGVLTKVTAMKNLLKLFKKMSENVGAAAAGIQRTELVVDEISQSLVKEDIKKEDRPKDSP